ncbi:MAG: arginine repressor [Prevotellaceae bacterium]|nr:arginine repressor [Prevotellaceae bacterium]
MKNKTKRLTAIKEIITGSVVGSQEELLQLLLEKGYELTQATLSRDLKHLKVAKTSNTSGEYVYQLAPQINEREEKTSVFSSGNILRSVGFSGNIAVLHTRPGYASSMASEIDENGKEVFLGTVAGDDTIIAVIRENVTREEVIENLSEFIPELTK